MEEQKKEKKRIGVFERIFMVIGVIAIVIVIAVLAIIIIKPYGVDVIKVIPAVLNENPTSSYDHPYLTTRQEAILESAGINPADVPTQATPAQQQCAVSILGAERVSEIVGGSEPSVEEILRVKKCLE